jgi:hypothetical protein
MTNRVGRSLLTFVLPAAAVLVFAGCSESATAPTGSGGSGGGGGGTGGAGGGSDPGRTDAASPDAGSADARPATDTVVQSDVVPPSNLAAYTVSYRSQVRVPSSGAVLSYDAFAAQVSRLDPIAAKRCPVSHDTEFQTAVNALGGINWTHPVDILKDLSQPPLYQGQIPPPRSLPTNAYAGADSSKSAAPTIERPDLVGYQDNIALFLSQRHGLLAVRTDTSTPTLSCALKLPGQPKYFFYHGKELVLLVNGMSVNEAALLRFAISSTGFDFLDAVMLDNQQIQDARLFDSTLVIYANLFDPPAAPTPALDGGVAPTRTASYSAPIGVKVTAVKWGDSLSLAWQEELLNDRASSDPLAGQNIVEAVKQLSVGQVVSSYKVYKPFISASDRYFVVSRDVRKTVFTGTVSQTYSYCAASHPGPEHTVQYCYPKYEQRPNPDYKDPQSTKGDYPCNGKSLLDCIQEAAPTISKYIYVRAGETCNSYSYHDYICDRTETKTISYPTYRTDASTQFVVYRYTDGDFVKLDERLFQMASPGTTSGTVGALTFTGAPLEVTGTIDHKGDLQFQSGHFYVLTNQGQVLHTLLIAGNSIAELGVQNTPRKGSSSSYSYSGTHSTLFSDSRMMVSRAYYDYTGPKGIYNWSDVIMMDLSAPSFPTSINQFAMPGSSDQLILAAAGVVGPGTVNFTSSGVQRNLQKITLFSQDNASEVDNVLLGTEYNADFTQTWLGVSDDQRIRLDWGSQRLFLPYSGYPHAAQTSFNPAVHRLNITAVGVGTGLRSEMTLNVVEDIVRTVSVSSSATSGRALAFGDSSIYTVNQSADGWSLGVLEELATPIAVYRMNDTGDLHARIDRIGARCQLSTFTGSLKAFAATQLATGPVIACPETGSPMAIGLTVVFSSASTGWRLSQDGTTITSLSADEVKEALTHVRNDQYCALDGSKTDGTPVPYLDTIPTSVQCYPWPTSVGGGLPTGGGLMD